jgi:hypothetical protein
MKLPSKFDISLDAATWTPIRAWIVKGSLPKIASVTFQGAAKGVRHMYDAFIAPDHDCDALGKGIVTLLGNPTLAAQLGAQARATVLATFHWRHICVDIERIYHKLVEAANQQNRSAPSARKWANVLPVESANNSEFKGDMEFSRLSQPVENPAMINDKKAHD